MKNINDLNIENIEKELFYTTIKTEERAKEYNVSKDQYLSKVSEVFKERKKKIWKEFTDAKIKEKIPEIYFDADINKIDKRIIAFKKSNKTFCWIYGQPGTGKTYSLYAMLVDLIKENIENSEFKILKEYEIKFDDEYKHCFALDDFGLSRNDNRNKYLIDFYFMVIDYFLENKKKLFITSNLSINEWIAEMKRINEDTVMRIASRLSNVTDFIELKGQDKRKIKV